MSCTPLSIPPGLFLTNTVWKSQTEAKTGKSATYRTGGSLRVSGPNGSKDFTPVSGQLFRHMFFGAKDYLAVLATGTTGVVDRRVYLIDFTTPTLTVHEILFVSVSATALFPWLQYSSGAGDACCAGAPTTDVGVKGLVICRSDNGSQLLVGPSPYLPHSGTFAKTTETELQIVDGTAVLARGALPRGRLEVSPASQTFATLTLGGTGPASDAKLFVLANKGTDCLTIASISSNGPYHVTSQSVPFPAGLTPGQSMTVTVTFAPTSPGAYDNVALAISRTPPVGSDKLVCSGHAATSPTPRIDHDPGIVDFGRVDIGSRSAPQRITLRNSGTQDAIVTVDSPPAGNPFSWVYAKRSLAAGALMGIDVAFTPNAEGDVAGTVHVEWSSPDGAVRGAFSVALRGTGVPVPLAVPVILSPADGASYPMVPGEWTVQISLSWQEVPRASGYIVQFEEWTDIIRHLPRPEDPEPRGPLIAPGVGEHPGPSWTAPAGYTRPQHTPPPSPPPLPEHRWMWVPAPAQTVTGTTLVREEMHYPADRTLRWCVAAVDMTGLYLTSPSSAWRKIYVAGSTPGGAGPGPP